MTIEAHLDIPGVFPSVEFAHDIAHYLDLLTDALEEPGTDLQTVLAVLVDDLAFEDLAADIRYAYGLDGQVVSMGTSGPPRPAQLSLQGWSGWWSSR